MPICEQFNDERLPPPRVVLREVLPPPCEAPREAPPPCEAPLDESTFKPDSAPAPRFEGPPAGADGVEVEHEDGQPKGQLVLMTSRTRGTIGAAPRRGLCAKLPRPAAIAPSAASKDSPAALDEADGAGRFRSAGPAPCDSGAAAWAAPAAARSIASVLVGAAILQVTRG